MLLRLYLLFFLTASLTLQSHCWRYDRRPKVYGSRLSGKVLLPWHRKVQRKILLYHNYFRSHVRPQASDMLLMRWHKGASEAAQNWASACKFLTHDTIRGRYLPRFGSCGQNIFISTQQVPWYFAIKTWYLERLNFTYGSAHNELEKVGHYTQMVWATTHRIGCGFAKCPGHYSYVCNYCPIGNDMEKLGRPYTRGPPCGECPDHCKHGRLCTNSCPVADHWANCKEIHRTWPGWLCATETPEGRRRQNSCRATCRCKGKIG